MAGNNFKIPVWTPELVNWSNQVKANNLAAAKQRQQDWNKVYDMATAYGEARKKEEEAQKARDFQAAENALQRQHQEQMQAQSLAAQAAQAAENRKAQQEYNLMVKGLEEAKQRQAMFDKAQVEYAGLLGKENPNDGELMRMNQIRQAFPEVDKYNKVDKDGNQVIGSLYDDSIASRNAAREEALRFAKFRNSIPTTFKNEKEKAFWEQKINEQGFDSQRTADLYNALNANKSLKTKVGEAVHGAIASNAGKNTTENLEKKKLQATAKDIVETYKANGGKITNRDYDKLIENNPGLKDYLARDGLGNLKLRGM